MHLPSSDLFANHQERVLTLRDQIASRERVVANAPTEQSPFTKLLSEGVSNVNNQQFNSNDLVEQLLAGEDVNQAEVFTSVQKAEMSFRLLVQIRNKLMQAYEELNSIRV